VEIVSRAREIGVHAKLLYHIDIVCKVLLVERRGEFLAGKKIEMALPAGGATLPKTGGEGGFEPPLGVLAPKTV
jgi:hypothetical protein